MHAWRFLLGAAVMVLSGTDLVAQEMVLEATNGQKSLQTCDYLHHISTCDVYHFRKEYSIEPVESSLRVGATVYLDEKAYRLEWMGPAYYLADGTVLHLIGPTSSSLAGAQWLEVYPVEGRVHVSSAWEDREGDRMLSPLDLLTFADRSSVVRDIRLNVRVTPIER